jgi:hypothetical protein
MQLKLPFRLTRGAAVVLVIVLAHVTIAALFIGMRVRVEVPELGPVFATLLPDPLDAAPKSAHPRTDPAPTTKPAVAPAAAAPGASDEVGTRE